jgi:DUF4097 and DUF4098 domain-containing protein YvlB
LKHSQKIVGLACLLALLAPLALTQEAQISKEGRGWGQVFTGSMSGVKNLRVKLDMGSVVVHGAQRSGIDYNLHMRSRSSSEQDARREFQAYKVSSYVKGDTAWIVGEWQGDHSYHVGSARLTINTRSERKVSGEMEINVPREMELVKIETGGGNVETTGIAGRLEADTGGGGMRMDDIGGGAKAETGGGSVDVGTINGDLRVHTGGGSIDVNHANGQIVAETGGGSVRIQSGTQGAIIETGGGGIEVRQCNGKVKVSTGGGNIDLGDIGGPAEIETGGGTIRLTSAKGPVRAQTGGGGIELWGVPSARAETGAGAITVKLVNTGGARDSSMLETSAGDITVYIASDVAINIHANVDLGNGHRITSDFPDIHVSSEGDQWGPKSLSAEGKLNGGGPVLKVRTTTGDICFRKAK